MHQSWSWQNRTEFFFSRISAEGMQREKAHELALHLTVFEVINDSVELVAFARGIRITGVHTGKNWEELATPSSVALAEKVLSSVQARIYNGRLTREWLTEMQTLYAQYTQIHRQPNIHLFV